MECSKCRKELDVSFNGNLARSEWLRLVHYIDHEYREEEITQSTYESMIDALMYIKPDDECDHCDAMKEYSKSKADEKADEKDEKYVPLLRRNSSI